MKFRLLLLGVQPRLGTTNLNNIAEVLERSFCVELEEVHGRAVADRNVGPVVLTYIDYLIRYLEHLPNCKILNFLNASQSTHK